MLPMKDRATDPVLFALSMLPRDAALVAVSGGRDSVALLHALHACGHRKLTVVHLDHRLRGRASTNDAKFVGRLATKLGYPLLQGRSETRVYAEARGVSLELAARELRHAFFAAAARRARCRTVILAHHGDDQAETCLFNFLRGSGAAGLGGMRESSTLAAGRLRLTFLRPWLRITRHQIDGFVESRRLAFREDETNTELAATRNRIRHGVLPAIREALGEACGDAIRRTADILAAEEDWMQAEVARIPSAKTLPVEDLRSRPLALQRRLIRRWLQDHALRDIGFAEIERVRSLLAVGSGPAKINLPGARHVRRRSGEIFLEPPRD